MNRSFGIIFVIVALALGFAIGRWLPGESADVSPISSESERKVLYWKAPMDPNYRRDEPGKSPMGMDLVPVYADEAGGDAPGVISIDPTVINNLGVRTASAERGALSRRIETVGYVGYDENTLIQVTTRVDGWIEQLAVKVVGDPVKRGEPLFELYSPTLVNAQEEYLAALRSGNTLLRRASRDRLGALGVTGEGMERLDKERTVRQRTRVSAPKDGVIVHMNVREGQFVSPATGVMAIASLDEVWVLAEVFERQAAWVAPGQRATVEFDALPGERREGEVTYVYPELDPITRTLKVRLRIDNEDGELRPNMFARVMISGAETAPVVHIPREALIRGGALDRVALALGDGRFRSQEVTAGIEAGDRVEIRSGLSAGDVVVTSGQFLIDSESNIESALSRMDPAGAAQAVSHVRVGAVVEGYRIAQRYITLRHDAVPEWSWPAMSMGFSVASENLLQGLEIGQSVEIVIEKRADDSIVVTDISPQATMEMAQ